jgi:hypothetical protein
VAERGIPRHVRAFIDEHLRSVAQLEILLLLHDAPEADFRADVVAQTLRIDPSWAGDELAGLARAGLLTQSNDTYRYAPRSDTLSTAVDGLSKYFTTHRVAVITQLFSAPSEGIGSFADAFKLRKEGDDG